MNSLLDTFKSLGIARLSIMAAVALAIIAFFIYFASRVAQPEMQMLYGELDPADSTEIASALDAEGVPYQLSSDGTRIMVPGDKVARLRLQMAERGLPNGASLGYEIFDRDEGLGANTFTQNINRLRALEGELARSIRTISDVSQARVHLVLPQRELFSRERNNASASIVLTLRGNRRPTQQKVTAIQQLVASAVPELSSDQVSIIDDKGNLLARAGGEDEVGDAASRAEDMRSTFETSLSRDLENLLERSVGIGNVRVEVSAEMDFDRVTESAELYDPDGQVVRSTQTIEENSQDSETGETPVTVANNLPDEGVDTEGSSSNSLASRVEETVNYEISKTVRTHVRESGEIKRLSIAILVNGTYAEDENGDPIYAPRSEEEMAKLAALARSAAGLNDARGDSLEIVNMAFAAVPLDYGTAATDSLLGIDEQELLRVAELIVLGLVAILVLLLVVRPLVGRLLEKSGEASAPQLGFLSGGGSGGVPALAGIAPDGSLIAGPDGLMPEGAAAYQAAGGMIGGPNVTVAQPLGGGHGEVGMEGDASGRTIDKEIEDLIDVERIEGRVRSSALKKVTEIIDNHPEEAVTIIRNWLYQDG